MDLGNMGIPAQVNPPAQIDPFAKLGEFAQIQGALNQNKLFNQTFAAKQRAGEIMSAAPDTESGLAQLLKDPVTAPFAGDAINSIRQGQLAQTQRYGELQSQGSKFLSGFGTAIGAAARNPSQLGPMLRSQIATLSPEMRAKMGDSIDSIVTSLTHDLPSDPAAAQHEYMTRAAPYIVSGPKGLQDAVLGAPTTVDTGGNILTGTQAPGRPFEATGSIGKTLAPQVITGKGPEGEDISKVVGGGGKGNALGADAGTLFTGPTQTKSSYNTERTKDFAGYEKALDDSVIGNQTGRKNMQQVMDAAQLAQTGGGAESFAKLGKALQALGVDTPTVDKWANGSLVGSEVIDKVSLANSMTALRQQIPPGSRANMQEFVAYLNKNPNLTTDPRAMVEIFNYWNSIYSRDLAEQKALDSAKSESGFDPKRWPAQWANSDFMKNWAPTTPFSGENIKGVGKPSGNPLASKPKDWKIVNGKLVPQ